MEKKIKNWVLKNIYKNIYMILSETNFAFLWYRIFNDICFYKIEKKRWNTHNFLPVKFSALNILHSIVNIIVWFAPAKRGLICNLNFHFNPNLYFFKKFLIACVFWLHSNKIWCHFKNIFLWIWKFQRLR